ncbi:polysaccharide deacteylase family 2 protein [uncultured Shimia sp.]|uniref:divergent polysaccharide deacetylase family protein n=1 Tax=uncultured Shimia sp. TaxID=573152 RepID=UPI00261BF706|nr:polysaccharide deacteylase family 2 protein [uncultured Shimia sp.]
MFRGLMSGVFWGAILVGGVLSATSLLSPLPATVKPQTKTDTPKATDEVITDSGAVGTESQADAAVEEATAAVTPAADSSDAPPVGSTDSAPKPETGTETAALAVPVAPATDGAVAVNVETPVLPNPQAETPAAPVPDSELSISTNPPQPEAPVVVENEVFPTPSENGAETGDAESLVTDVAPIEDAEEDITPKAEAAEEDMVEEAAAEESLLKPATDLNETFEQRTSTRLPTVGADEEDSGETQATRPVEYNAEQFENAEEKPVMAIVLVDTGEATFDMEALESFPYPLSIAVNTLDPDVAAKTKDYRARGFEVLAMVDMPTDATASDVEQALQAHLSVSDAFVGVMEGLEDGLQGSKEISDQVTQALLGSGHGLLMFANGLNTAQKLAAKEGVPSATVFRDFDDKGQTAAVMRRFLDGAAFKAGQEQGVVMVGRLRDVAISALLLWALQDRAGTVAIAPVSATFDTIN